jgi:hypothetical protein
VWIYICRAYFLRVGMKIFLSSVFGDLKKRYIFAPVFETAMQPAGLKRE